MIKWGFIVGYVMLVFFGLADACHPDAKVKLDPFPLPPKWHQVPHGAQQDV